MFATFVTENGGCMKTLGRTARRQFIPQYSRRPKRVSTRQGRISAGPPIRAFECAGGPALDAKVEEPMGVLAEGWRDQKFPDEN
jgi:hypothetical protein